MRILFSSTHGTGHVTPLLPFVRAARAAGHDVLLAGAPPIAPIAAREGLAFHENGWPDDDVLAAARARVAALRGPERLRVAMRALFIDAYAAAALPGMLALVEAWRPDAILHETAEVSAALAGDALGVPVARVGVALASCYEDRWLEATADPIDALRARHGLPADPGGHRAARRPILTQAPPSLERGQGRLPFDVRRFRATDITIDDDTAVACDDPRPHVPVSFGTVVPVDGHYPGLYRAVVDAIAGLPVRVTVAIGRDVDPAALGAVPGNVRVAPWVPMGEMLSDAAAFVTHGGAGTTLAALAAGVPMAVLPVSADQPLNAELVAAHGAGLALHDGPARLREAVLQLLQDPRHRDAARAVAHEIAALPPVAAAVEQIEALSPLPSAAP